MLVHLGPIFNFVNGTTTTIDTTNTTVKGDSIIELANGTSGSPSNDAGLVIERGS